jgi:tRNA(adenine34) deaminase
VPDQSYESAMLLALDEARSAVHHDDIPIGAVLLDPDGMTVAAEHNRREESHDVTAHAEILALSQRTRELGDWRLEGHTMVVTLEPCAMCAMAAVWARLERIVYGAADPRAGAALSLYNIPQDPRLNHRIEVVSGVMAEEAGALLEDFFGQRR